MSEAVAIREQPGELTPEQVKPNLYQRILAVIAESGAMAKTGQANFGGSYAYHKIDDVVEHLRPIMLKHGVVMVVSVEDHQDLQGTDKMPFRAVTRLLVKLVNADAPEDTLQSWSVGEGLDNGDKASGKAISYSLKNWLLANFQLRGQPDNEEETKDPGERRTKPRAEATKRYQLTSGERKRVEYYLNRTDAAQYIVDLASDKRMSDVLEILLAKGAENRHQVEKVLAACEARWPDEESVQ